MPRLLGGRDAKPGRGVRQATGGLQGGGQAQALDVFLGPERWLGQSCASRCTGRAWRGSIRPLSKGSSHRAGVEADVFLQCLTTQEIGGNGPSRPGGNLGF